MLPPSTVTVLPGDVPYRGAQAPQVPLGLPPDVEAQRVAALREPSQWHWLAAFSAVGLVALALPGRWGIYLMCLVLVLYFMAHADTLTQYLREFEGYIIAVQKE